jgi:hemerythrin
MAKTLIRNNQQLINPTTDQMTDAFQILMDWLKTDNASHFEIYNGSIVLCVFRESGKRHRKRHTFSARTTEEAMAQGAAHLSHLGKVYG